MTQPPEELDPLRQIIAEQQAKEKARAAEKTAEQHTNETFDPALVPDVPYERSEADLEIDSVLNRIDIITAYNKWCGKSRPKVLPGQVESIMVRCPIPAHTDEDPSCWINTDKQVWNCGACGEGGDKYDFAAIFYGMWVYGKNKPYKDGANFHRLREDMAADFGYTVQKLAGGEVVITPPELPTPPTPPPPPNLSVVKEPEPSIAGVIDLIDDTALDAEPPGFDWRPLVPEESFLDEYMKAVCVDDVPEEFHFFHGLLAIGFALGRQVRLFDAVPVYSNLFVCTLGRSGSGKSKARRHLDDLLQSALPYDGTTSPPRGVRRINAPGSAESLIFNFQKPVEDPNNPKNILYFDPIRGLVDFNELSSLLGRANRQGNVLKPTLMQFYDMDRIIQTHSMATGSKEAHEPFASALTTSQPRALSGLIDKTDDSSGFLNRWIFVTGREKRRFSVGGVMVDIGPAVKPLEEISAWASTFRADDMVQWSQGALKIFDDWFQNILEPHRRKAKNDLLVRMDLLMKKLILLFTANKHEGVVSEETVETALSLYRYFVGAYGIPEGQIGNTIYNEVSEAVIDQMKKIEGKTGRAVSVRDISRNLARRNYDSRIIAQVIDTLVKVDLVEVVNDAQTGPGRRTKRYHYVG